MLWLISINFYQQLILRLFLYFFLLQLIKSISIGNQKIKKTMKSTNKQFQKDAKKHQFTGYPGDCSQEQKTALNQFRQFVIEQNGNRQNVAWDEYYLLRFLRARKFNLQKTKIMWTNFIKWRVQNDIQNAQDFYLPELPEIRKLYPHGYHKVDRQYRPIYIQRIGQVNTQQVFKHTTPERMIKYYASSYQTLIHRIFDACTEMRKRQTGKEGKVQQTITILDIEGIKLSKVPKSYDFIKLASGVAQDNYPQILGNMFIVNAPMLFTGLWAIISNWVDPKTRDKIKIMGGRYSKQLLEFIAPENLPSFLKGGKCECQGGCLGNNPGPWSASNQQLFIRMLTKPEDRRAKNLMKNQNEEEEIMKSNQQLKQQALKKQNKPQFVSKSERIDTRSLYERGLACSNGIPFTGKVFIPHASNIKGYIPK